MAFERRISRWLPKQFQFDKFYYDWWIKFFADGKIGWAQPDMWGVVDEFVILGETKLSYNKAAIPQLNKLYFPLIRFLYPAHTIICIHIYKHNRGKLETLPTIQTALELPGYKRREVLFYQHIH